jgi:hypothetical protein
VLCRPRHVKGGFGLLEKSSGIDDRHVMTFTGWLPIAFVCALAWYYRHRHDAKYQ